MKIAVTGSNMELVNRIAKDAFHRHYGITVSVQDSSLLDSVKYTLAEKLNEEDFDAVINVCADRIIIKKNGESCTAMLPEKLDLEARRLGEYSAAKVNSAGESYAGAGDYAMAIVDKAVDFAAGEAYFVTEHAPALPEENSGRRRYVTYPDKGIAGKAFRLYMDDFNEYFVHFITDDTLHLSKKGEPLQGYACKCLHCDDNVWMAIFMRGEQCVTMILDEAQSLVTVIYAETFKNKPQLVHHKFLFGAIIPFCGEAPFRRHGFTDEFVGNKITWHYSPYVNITHCYINESYMRNSLRSMKELPADASPEAVFDAEDRIRRWGGIFFEEPAQYIRINDHLYIVALAESNRNRVDPMQGGGDMVLAINTRRMRDYGRGFHVGLGVPSYGLISVNGDWDDMPDKMDDAVSPYLM